MVRQFKEVFASASRSSPAKLDCLSCLSSQESSSVFDGLMSFAIDSLFGVGEMPTFTTMLQLSPNAARERPLASAAGVGAVHASRASAATEREQCSRVERAAPSSENDGLVPAWVIDTLRNEKVGHSPLSPHALAADLSLGSVRLLCPRVPHILMLPIYFRWARE